MLTSPIPPVECTRKICLRASDTSQRQCHRLSKLQIRPIFRCPIVFADSDGAISVGQTVILKSPRVRSSTVAVDNCWRRSMVDGTSEQLIAVHSHCEKLRPCALSSQMNRLKIQSSTAKTLRKNQAATLRATRML